MKFSKKHIIIFAATFTITSLIVLAVMYSKNTSATNIWIKQGFDFRKLHTEDPRLSPYKVGEKINLANLRNSENQQISQVAKENLLMFALIDPLCPACKFSNDMMSEIRKTAKSSNIGYYPILVSPSQQDVDLKGFAQEFGFQDCFHFVSDTDSSDQINQSLTPTHILTNSNGIVVQVWAGTNKDEAIRKVMAEQISTDLLLVKDAYTSSSSIENQSKP